MSVLVIAEHDNSELKSATLNAVTAAKEISGDIDILVACLLYTSPSPRDQRGSRMPSSA